MVLWFIVGLIVWILCVLFMFLIIKGGHRTRGNVYERKLHFRSMTNTQKIEGSKKEVKKSARKRRNQCLPISAHK